MFCNRISLIVGIIVVGAFSFLWLALALALGLKGISFAVGIVAVFMAIGMGGKHSLPIESIGFLLFLGRRVEHITGRRILFQEGIIWIPPLIASVQHESRKERFHDVPPLEVLTKDKVEVKIDVQISWRVVDLFKYSNLEKPQETIAERLTSKSYEASDIYIKNHTYNHISKCGKEEVQEAIRETIEQEVENWGVEIINIDVKPIMPAKEIRDEFKKNIAERAENQRKQMRTDRFVKDLKKIKEELGEEKISGDTLTNVTQTVEGVIKKEVKEEKKTYKIDIEPAVLKTAAELFKKSKEGETK